MSRRSARCTNGSIGWVDNTPCLRADAIVADLLESTLEWNLYVAQCGDIRHSFVVHKDAKRRCFYFYDYMGKYFLRDKTFVTTVVYSILKKDKALGYTVGFGQLHEIEGEEYSNLCMKNSAFVMKYHCAPADRYFNSPYCDYVDLTSEN